MIESIENLSNAVKGRKLDTDTVAKLHNVINEATSLLEQIEHETGPDRLLLKWGTWKAWRSDNPKIKALIHQATSIKPDTNMAGPSRRQRNMICQVIDMMDGVIRNDFTGEYYTKSEAKKYVIDYGK